MGADHTPTVPLSATAFANRLRWYAHLLLTEERVLFDYMHEQHSVYRAGDEAAFARSALARHAYRSMREDRRALLALADRVHAPRPTDVITVVIDSDPSDLVAPTLDSHDRTAPHGDALA